MIVEHRQFLPSKTRTCHASSFDFQNGDPIFSWFGGTQEGHSDTAIYILKNKDIIAIGNKDYTPRWNPVISTIGKRVYLWHKKGITFENWQTVINDITEWNSEVPRKEVNDQIYLAAGLNGPVKNKPIFNGDLILCGSSQETFASWASYIEAYKIENGKIECVHKTLPLQAECTTYEKNGGFYRSKGIIQPTLWEQDGKFHALFRSCGGYKFAFYSNSDKNGMLWAKPSHSNIENPNSSMDCAYYDGHLYIAYNPSNNSRTKMVVGKFKHKNGVFDLVDSIVINDTAKSPISAECSYPFLREKNGEMHLTYTYGRIAIEYCIISQL